MIYGRSNEPIVEYYIVCVRLQYNLTSTLHNTNDDDDILNVVMDQSIFLMILRIKLKSKETTFIVDLQIIYY